MDPAVATGSRVMSDLTIGKLAKATDANVETPDPGRERLSL